MRGVGWISVRVCLKSDGIVFHFIYFYLIIIITVLLSLSTHNACAHGMDNLLPAARGTGLHCTRAREGGLALARGVLLGILDLAAKLAVLTGDMPAVLVDVSRTVIPRGLAMDLRCTRVSGLEGTIDTNPRTNLP